MLGLRDDVLGQWEQRVRLNVKPAADLPRTIIINTFPGLYVTLAESISPGYPCSLTVATTTIAAEHGGDRARLTGYDARAVIVEFDVLRATIVEVMDREGIHFDSTELDIINASFDIAIREAVTSFVLAQSVLCERVVAAIVQDLRYPLSTASTASEILNSIVDTPRAKELGGLISDNLDRIQRMAHDLLERVIFQTGERLRPDVTRWDMLRLANEVAKRAHAMYGPRFEVRGMNVTGYWDRQAVKRALENLIDNALRYSAPDSPIRISIDVLHARTMILITNDKSVVPPDQLESVFQVYQRAIATKPGDVNDQQWGVGLPYVRSVAESHGGSACIESPAGRGTTYVIDLPVDSRPFTELPTAGTDL